MHSINVLSSAPISVHRNRRVALFYISLTLRLIALSTACQVVGFTVPGWLVVDMDVEPNSANILTVFWNPDVSQNYAVWYVVLCNVPKPKSTLLLKANEQCKTKSYMALDDDGVSHRNAQLGNEGLDSGLWLSKSFIMKWQMQEVLALVCTLVAVYYVYMQRIRISLLLGGLNTDPPTKCRFALALVFTLTSGFNRMMVACEMAALNIEISELPGWRNVTVHPPYGLIIATIGGALALIAALFLTVPVFKDEYSKGLVHDAECLPAPVLQMVPLVPARNSAVTPRRSHPEAPCRRSSETQRVCPNRQTFANDSYPECESSYPLNVYPCDDPPTYEECVRDEQYKPACA